MRGVGARGGDERDVFGADADGGEFRERRTAVRDVRFRRFTGAVLDRGE